MEGDTRRGEKMKCKSCGNEILADETNNEIGLCIFCEVKEKR